MLSPPSARASMMNRIDKEAKIFILHSEGIIEKETDWNVAVFLGIYFKRYFFKIRSGFVCFVADLLSEPTEITSAYTGWAIEFKLVVRKMPTL